ncbi:MAG: enoyl-CoA hydratase/isomerase family protein [Candidatus Omnitrophica bacterium]|nr:enoyl-CoA hydratase/isomerase family protein [Candidatus Omnitrophota bacterium]
MPIASGQHLKVSIEDHIAVITIQREPMNARDTAARVNALNSVSMQELNRCLDELKTDQEVKVVIITGGGSLAFVAGADIGEIAQLTNSAQAREVAAKGQAVITKIQRLGKPVIAAINGVCLGGGLELAMACHLRVAGDRVRFGQPEANLGIIPGFGGTQRLPRLIGKAKATELILTGDIIMAQEALRLGLVNQVVPQDQVLKAAKDLARKIASKGQVAVRESLAMIEQGLELSLDEGLAKEAEAFGRIAETHDCKEGVSAFLEKRQPKFQDR